MAEKDRIKGIIKEKLPFMGEKYHVKEVGIFGSVARGDYGTKSDVDVLVEFSQPIGLFDFIGLQNYLTRLVKRKVDLVHKQGIKSVIKRDILQETIYV